MHAFCSVVSLEGSERGSWTLTDLMFAWPGDCVTSVTSEAPLVREVFALELALNFGANFRALQFATWNGDCAIALPVAPPGSSVVKLPTVETVWNALQLVGLIMNPGLFTATLMFLMRSGTPLRILGSVLSTITWEVNGSTVIPARVTTVPKLKGPATAGTLIDRPYGEPWYGPVR